MRGGCGIGLYITGHCREILKEERNAIAVDEPQVKRQVQQEEKISVMRVSFNSRIPRAL